MSDTRTIGQLCVLVASILVLLIIQEVVSPEEIVSKDLVHEVRPQLFKNIRTAECTISNFVN